MNTIDRKYLLFQTQTAFEEALRMNNVRNDAIVFIKDPKQIYTHGTYWDCQDSGKQDSDFQAWFNKQDVPTKKWVQDYVKGQLDKITPKADGTITYTAGEGIDITGTTIKLAKATDSSRGGFKTGYVRNGNSLPVSLNGQERAYVYIPDDLISGGGGGGNKTSKYYEIIFKTTNTDTPPDLPTSDNMDGWKQYAENSDGSKVVWMAMGLVSNGTVSSWEGPWRISGPNGENGVDGDRIEYIYKLTREETRPDTPGGNIAVQTDDYVPSGWKDNPQGINDKQKYEWMSMRFKTFSKENPNGEWSTFISPVLWSAYGRNGTDGDGVEYIYYTSNNIPVWDSTSGNDPSTWYNDDYYQTRPEYIRTGQGSLTPQLNKWLDDPYGFENSDVRPGARIYVAIRKKKMDSSTNTMRWQAYSKPKQWSYYALNGDAGIGVVADLDNDTMCVSLKEDGNNNAFTQSSKVYLYNGQNTISCSARIISATFSDGSVAEGWSQLIKVDQNVANKINVAIPANAYNFKNRGTMSVVIEVKGVISGAEVTREAVLNILGVNFGVDGVSYSLVTGAKVIRKNKAGVLAPSSISVQCTEVDGAMNMKTWNPANSPEGFSFWYFLNDDYSDERELFSNTIETSWGITDSVTVRLKYYKDGNLYTVDQETIFVVSDGIDGGWIPAVYYDIQVQSTTLSKVYTGDSAKLQGKLTWKVFKVEGNTRTEITSANKTEMGADIYMKYGNNSTPAQWSNSESYWYTQLKATWNDSYSYSQIILKIDDVPTASIVVPTIMNGKDGKDAENLQTLSGAVMRLTEWQANPANSYNDGTTAEKGIYYLDVVQYGNELFKCIESHKPQTANDHPLSEGFSGKWSKINAMSDAAFHTLLAKDSYIENLTAKQIVITKKQQTIGGETIDVPVAGMVNSDYVTQKRVDGTDNISSDCGVRIFAGTIPATGNLASTAFNVDEMGNVKAGAGSIVLNANGSGYVAGGKISWDQNGNITAFGVNPFIGGSTQLVNQAYKNMLYITKILFTMSESQQKWTVCGFIISNGWIVAPFNVTCSNKYPITVSNLENYTLSAQQLFNSLCSENSPFYDCVRKSGLISVNESEYIYENGDNIWIEIPDGCFYFKQRHAVEDLITGKQSYYYMTHEWKSASSGFVQWQNPS